ncbi:uncharacterized protein A1O9_07532 [Exophiala aquamarina CBS 119918]|uniref:Uncharacterized protein n=1 Tax=Exophiala aquamarina CBS 119918 TaxID=1182545 RepID=A0A072P871_9EURO|nr:uncharacterized protein A1O9_07532 [Exophiala aquamarina CBS 119918]KEF55952.1 hypothetical protein A1O9_07532 [Exophiala aquamarina CBS 119918]
MLQSIAKFSNDAVGLEKTLKFTQFSSHVIAALSATSLEAARWNNTKANINTARRFFRLFKWIDCFNAAQAQLSPPATVSQEKSSERTSEKTKQPADPPRPESDNLKVFLTVSKFSLLGMYLFMEMFVITDSIGLTSYPWSGSLQIEALKVWFYSLAVSILLGLYELSILPSSSAPEAKGKAKSAPPASPPQDESQPKRRAIYKQLVIDMSDLIVPGHVAGWFPVDTVTVGVAGSISGLLGAHSAWERVNGPLLGWKW